MRKYRIGKWEIMTQFLPDESYSKLMLTEGALAVVDEQTNFVMELPEWVDEKKIKMWALVIFSFLN